MGSKADFYVGRGFEAEWLGSLEWDGLPEGLPRSLLTVTTEEVYRQEVGGLLSVRGDAMLAENGWPWPWDTSHGTKYAYAFDPAVNCVMASCFGSSWWVASDPEPEHTTLNRKAAVFPDMSLAKKGGGVYVVPEGVEVKANGTRKKPRARSSGE